MLRIPFWIHEEARLNRARRAQDELRLYPLSWPAKLRIGARFQACHLGPHERSASRP
jgi:hypothetical protein